MKSVEDLLISEKKYIDNLEVPDEMEDKLRNALESNVIGHRKNTKVRPWYMRHKAAAAILAFLVLIVSFNYDTLAYYGKKILGYDNVSFGAVKDLNDLGMGQVIGKSYTFKDGSQVILDGVMYDDNKLIAFYRTRTNSQENSYNFDVGLKGVLKNYHQKGGAGILSEDNKEVAWNMTYEKPFILDKNLTLNISYKYNNSYENGKINFTLDKSKAMGHTIKGELNQSIEVDGVKYNFESITATPLSVIVEGSIVGNEALDFLKPAEKGHFEHDNLVLKLSEKYIRNGEPVTEIINFTGGEIGGSKGSIHFKCSFDGLKPNLKELNLVFEKIASMKVIDKQININSQSKDLKVVDYSDEIVISNVAVKDNVTSVTFITPSDIEFDTVLSINNQFIQDEKPSLSNLKINGKDYIEKIYHFNAADKDMKLMFKGFSHVTYVNKNIVLPIGK